MCPISLAKSIKQYGLYHIKIAKQIVKNSINQSVKELDQNVTISAIHKENFVWLSLAYSEDQQRKMQLSRAKHFLVWVQPLLRLVFPLQTCFYDKQEVEPPAPSVFSKQNAGRRNMLSCSVSQTPAF